MKRKIQGKQRIHITHATSRKLNALLFLLPWLIGFTIFFLIPLWNTILYSFNSVEVGETGGIELKFIGIQNYVDLFRTEVSTQKQQFARVFVDENVNILINTPVITVFSLFLAIIANINFKGRGIVRVIFFLPVILGVKVVIDLLTISTGGDIIDAALSNTLNDSVFMSTFISHTFLPMNVTKFMMSVINNISSLILQAGVQTLVFLAGLQSINPSIYEVAKIEGANSYEVFWKITLPMLSRITLFVVIYTFVDLFLKSSITTEIYQFAFRRNNIGVGSALSVVYMVNTLLDLAIFMLAMRTMTKGGNEA